MNSDMSIKTNQAPDYRMIKTTKVSQPAFINIRDEDAVEMVRNQYDNTNIKMSICSFESPHPSAQRTYPLYFRIVSNNSEKVRRSVIESLYYIAENFHIPEDCIEIIYNGSGNASKTEHKPDNTTFLTEMVILIPPVIYDGQPTPVMPAINYQLARQLTEDGINHLDIDVYQRDYFIRLPNSVNNTTGRFVIPLQMKELLYLDACRIMELANQPRPEDCLILPRQVPEAVQWFAQLCKQTEKIQHKQSQIQKLLLEKGWQVPPCIWRLQRICLYDDIRLEAYRVISQFYSWIKASCNQIWQQIQSIDRLSLIHI